jgi:hypothetical protein
MRIRTHRSVVRTTISSRGRPGGAGVAAAILVALISGFTTATQSPASPRAAEGAGSEPPCHQAFTYPRRRIAPGLRLIKVSRSYGTCRQAIRVNARGPANVLWANDSTNGLWRSTDDARTWRLTYRATGYVTVDNVLRLRSGHLLIIVQRGDGRRFILRSLDRAGHRFGKPVFRFPFNPAVHTLHDSPRILSGQSWLQLGKSIYIGEYGGNLNPVYIWKSTNDGRSFGVATSFTAVAHVHSLYADPFVRGRLWATIGDSGPAPRIGYSSNGGRTFTWITKGVYPQSRAVGLFFTRSAVLWATDTPEVKGPLSRWDRAKGSITELLPRLIGPWFYNFQARGAFAGFSYIASRPREGYLGDEFVHVLTSVDGNHWKNTRTTFMRSREALRIDSKAGPTAITTPDARGRFWVYLINLQGSQGFTTNAEFQLGP